MHQITSQELAEWLADENRPNPQLLDVREPWEFEMGHIQSAMPIPMHTVPVRLNDIQPDEPVVCICHHGGRSMQVAMFLQSRGYSTIYNLSGGMDVWSQVVDTSIRRY
jgi:rhodanese-related sulfurtransferase